MNTTQISSTSQCCQQCSLQLRGQDKSGGELASRRHLVIKAKSYIFVLTAVFLYETVTEKENNDETVEFKRRDVNKIVKYELYGLKNHLKDGWMDGWTCFVVPIVHFYTWATFSFNTVEFSIIFSI